MGAQPAGRHQPAGHADQVVNPRPLADQRALPLAACSGASLPLLCISLEQEGILEVEEQAAVSSALRAILCDAVPQLAAVIASASDLVGLRGQAAMHAALMQCTINCAATRTGSHKLPLLTDDIKAVLQTACDALQDMGGTEQAGGWGGGV